MKGEICECVGNGLMFARVDFPRKKKKEETIAIASVRKSFIDLSDLEWKIVFRNHENRH